MRLDNYSVICSFDTVSIRAANMAIDISKNRNGGFMLASLSLIFLVGLAMGAICQKLKMPRIIGMLVTGIVLGPYVLDFLDPSILSISSELRKLALIIILLKAGLSLDLKDLKKAGRPAILMSFVPATCEIAGYILFAPLLLGINRIEAAVMGAVLGAVSPAVVIPRMVMLMEEKYGTKKAIPQMIMAGGIRDYTESDISWVEHTICMRNAGVPIEALIEYIRLFQMGDATFEARCQLLKEQYEQLDEQKKQIENTMERLQYKISKYENAIKTGELTWDK